MRLSMNYPFKHRIRIDVTQQWCSFPVSREHALPFPHILPVAMMSEAERTGLTSAMGTPSGGRQCSTIMPLIGTSFPWGSCSKFLRRSVWKDKRQLSLQAESKPIFGLCQSLSSLHILLSRRPLPFVLATLERQGKRAGECRHSQRCSGHLLELQVSWVQFSWTVLPHPHCACTAMEFFSLCALQFFLIWRQKEIQNVQNLSAFRWDKKNIPCIKVEYFVFYLITNTNAKIITLNDNLIITNANQK